VTSASILLFLTSCGTAITHALIPDHWLPFVVMARSQRWSDARAALLAALAGLLHVLLSILIGTTVIVAGRGSAEDLAARADRPLGFLTGAMLVLFGVGYGVWAHRREARVHGGTQDHGGEPGHLHAHGHLLERWFRRAVSGGALVVIIGISPCAVLAPILFAASVEGPAALVAAAAGFAVCTIGTAVIATLIAIRGLRRINLAFFTRYGDLLSGALVAAVGFVIMVLEA
jgi:hypothetical protein